VADQDAGRRSRGGLVERVREDHLGAFAQCHLRGEAQRRRLVSRAGHADDDGTGSLVVHHSSSGDTTRTGQCA